MTKKEIKAEAKEAKEAEKADMDAEVDKFNAKEKKEKKKVTAAKKAKKVSEEKAAEAKVLKVHVPEISDEHWTAEMPEHIVSGNHGPQKYANIFLQDGEDEDDQDGDAEDDKEEDAEVKRIIERGVDEDGIEVRVVG